MKEPPIRKEPVIEAETGPDPMDEIKRREAERDPAKPQGAKVIPLPMPPD